MTPALNTRQTRIGERAWCPLCHVEHVTQQHGQLEFLERGACPQRRAPVIVSVRRVLVKGWRR